ncbi:leucine-rich repeat protein [Salinibacterium sp. NG253]|uniref:leucine-rich repeat protein n=1 Tax=Salinibacterium sp. NG253 TaxID=2792039 RepID=UPI0018CCF2EB|nr:leucine-rich repeat protein [Salinibacterium sp. NG253]MBH0117265.1 leucine-rich repeat protein [Salinibacterium sp. NG253]
MMNSAASSPAPIADRPANRMGRIAAVLVASALVAAGSAIAATPAYAFPVLITQDGMTFEGDDFDPAAGATVTAYNPTAASGGTDAVIPSSVTISGDTYPVVSIGYAAFRDEGLTSVVIPSSVKVIGNSAFEANHLDSAVIPNSVTSLGDSAFNYNGMTTVTIGNSVESIGEYAFEDNDLETVVIPDSVTTIGEYAFYENSLTSVTLGSSLVTIDDSAFEGNLLTSVTFPASIAAIGAGAFQLNGSPFDVVFLGAAPTMFVPAGLNGSLGASSPTLVHYGSAFAAPAVAAGFTSPTWQGYNVILNPIVTFDLAGRGAAIAPTEVPFGAALAAPAEPTASGYTFDGWYTDAALTTLADFSTVIAADTALFAGWSAVAAAAADAEPMLAATGISAPLLPIGVLAALLLAAGIVLRRRMA